MATKLFSSPVFGPVQSRRFGVSLGINLLPADGKICSFDCIYCECGLNKKTQTKSGFPEKTHVIEVLSLKLASMSEEGELPDVITFAGNGEPTLHPDFLWIIQETVRIRDTYAPNCEISVLTNGSRIIKEDVFKALLLVDNNCIKLDTVDKEYIDRVDCPKGDYNLNDIIDKMKAFGKDCIIQTMFVQGEVDGFNVDNTRDYYVTPWINTLQEINPKKVMIYTIDRETPSKGLQKASKAILDSIADRVRKETGLEVDVSY
ncbi:MAG TPA: radical SAM protein [Bacteroidaceae bacterium]|nr:radical SAM protein [Bacteroidaceae bacterium]